MLPDAPEAKVILINFYLACAKHKKRNNFKIREKIDR